MSHLQKLDDVMGFSRKSRITSTCWRCITCTTTFLASSVAMRETGEGGWRVRSRLDFGTDNCLTRLSDVCVIADCNLCHCNAVLMRWARWCIWLHRHTYVVCFRS